MNDKNQHSSEEHEPDYRFTLANERTFLAWIRTALALLAAAVVITQFVPDFGASYARRGLAAALALISVAVVIGSAFHWHAAQKAMRRDQGLPSTRMPWLLAMGVIIVGLMAIILAVVYGVD